MGIIEKMYDNEEFQGEEIKSRKYHEILSKVCKAEDELLEKFPECKDLFMKYQAAEIDLMDITLRQKFMDGVKIGGKLMVEIMF